MTKWKVEVEACYTTYTKLFDDPHTAVGVARNLLGFSNADGEGVKVSVSAVIDEEDDF